MQYGTGNAQPGVPKPGARDVRTYRYYPPSLNAEYPFANQKPPALPGPAYLTAGRPIGTFPYAAPDRPMVARLESPFPKVASGDTPVTSWYRQNLFSLRAVRLDASAASIAMGQAEPAPPQPATVDPTVAPLPPYIPAPAPPPAGPGRSNRNGAPPGAPADPAAVLAPGEDDTDDVPSGRRGPQPPTTRPGRTTTTLLTQPDPRGQALTKEHFTYRSSPPPLAAYLPPTDSALRRAAFGARILYVVRYKTNPDRVRDRAPDDGTSVNGDESDEGADEDDNPFIVSVDNLTYVRVHGYLVRADLNAEVRPVKYPVNYARDGPDARHTQRLAEELNRLEEQQRAHIYPGDPNFRVTPTPEQYQTMIQTRLASPTFVSEYYKRAKKWLDDRDRERERYGPLTRR